MDEIIEAQQELKTNDINKNKLEKYLEERLKDKVRFDFYILYVDHDVHLFREDDCHHASLSKCLEVISEKGLLIYDDFDLMD